MSQFCLHDDASEDAQAFDQEPPRAFDKLSSGGEFSSAAVALNYDVVLVERNSVLDDGWEVGRTSLAVCRSLQHLRNFPQRPSLPSTQNPQFRTRESCTRCRTSLSSSAPSPVRRWWCSPILMSSCPTPVFASLNSLAFLSVTSTSLIWDGSWWMRTPCAGPRRSRADEPTQQRASTSVPSASAPRVVPPRVPPGNGNGDVLKMLRGLGLSEDLLVQVASAGQEGFFAGKADGSKERAAAQPAWSYQ